MTREEATIEACAIFALVYHSVGDLTRRSDGFCSRCAKVRGEEWSYQNDGHVFDYVRKAILRQLAEDGFSVAPGFDPDTGKEAVPGAP